MLKKMFLRTTICNLTSFPAAMVLGENKNNILMKGKALRKPARENSSLGFIEAVHQW